MEIGFITLQDFYTYTKGMAYILIVVTLIGLAGYWSFLSSREK